MEKIPVIIDKSPTVFGFDRRQAVGIRARVQISDFVGGNDRSVGDLRGGASRKQSRRNDCGEEERDGLFHVVSFPENRYFSDRRVMLKV